MNKIYRHLLVTIGLLAIIGLSSSMIHYHSSGLECLHHAEESHIVENIHFCPICSLVVDHHFNTYLQLNSFLQVEGNLILPAFITHLPEGLLPSKSRAPPISA